jgi:hypothetical protein
VGSIPALRPGRKDLNLGPKSKDIFKELETNFGENQLL